jgi:hypothetical protein
MSNIDNKHAPANSALLIINPHFDNPAIAAQIRDFCSDTVVVAVHYMEVGSVEMMMYKLPLYKPLSVADLSAI